MKRTSLAIILTAVLIIGCTETKVIMPTEDESVSLTISDLPEEVNSFMGATHEVTFTVVLQNRDGIALSGKDVRLEVITGAAQVSPETASSDDKGKVQAVLKITLPEGDGAVQVSASSDGAVTFASVLLHGSPVPASIKLRAIDEDPEDKIIEYIALVRDENLNSLTNIQVRFNLVPKTGNPGTFGTITSFANTDELGIARATFNSLGQFGTQYVLCAVSEEGLDEPVEEEIIMELNAKTATLTLSTDRGFVWADGIGFTQANLTAVLKDTKDRVMVGEEITFVTNFEHSVVQSPLITDSFGRVTTVFDDNRVPSVDSVTVTALHEDSKTESTIRIMIREQNPLSEIRLYASARQLTAKSGDSTNIRASCLLADGSPAPAGIMLICDADDGYFVSDTIYVKGNAGQATTWYIAGDRVGPVHIVICYIGVTDTVCSNIVVINLIAGPPSSVEVTANPTELRTSDPNSFSTITATITDTSGNPVRQGTYVTFATTLGTITPSAITDETGDAVALLRPGVTAGLAEVTATCQGIEGIATVTFTSGNPNSITLVGAPNTIPINSGQAALTATVRDPSGNLLEMPTSVVFELINEIEPPRGCSFNPGEQIFLTRTSGGIATATLNAGSSVGPKLIRVYTWRDSLADPEDIIEVIQSPVAVIDGVPFQIDIDVDDNGIDAGGGAWVIEVAARIWDRYRNPVADRIPVAFSVDPQIATINSAFTGNENNRGETMPGVAYTNLVYNSSETFEAIEINAMVVTEEGEIERSREHILPLQDGRLELNVDPANWLFEGGREDAEIRCWVVLNDGHGVEINSAPVLFSSDRAQFGWRDLDNVMHRFYPDAVRKYTGIRDQENDEEPGQATVYLLADEDDIFLDPFTQELSVQINARVEGYEEVSARPEFILFTRRAR